MPTKTTQRPSPVAPQFKMPKKPFKIRVGGVEVLVPITIKGKIPDSVIERAVQAAFLSSQKSR